MPAAAVIPALQVYINVVAVETLVVEIMWFLSWIPWGYVGSVEPHIRWPRGALDCAPLALRPSP